MNKIPVLAAAPVATNDGKCLLTLLQVFSLLPVIIFVRLRPSHQPQAHHGN